MLVSDDTSVALKKGTGSSLENCMQASAILSLPEPNPMHCIEMWAEENSAIFLALGSENAS